MTSVGAGFVETLAQLDGTALAQVLELMADEKSYEVCHTEARDNARCAVADSRRVIEGGVELGA